MFTGLRFTSLLVVLVSTVLYGRATPTQPSTDISSRRLNPSSVFNFQVVIQNGVYRSGQPNGELDWQYLEDIGIKTVVKLNEFSADVDKDEEKRMADKHRIKLVPIYMQPEDWPHNWNPWVRPDLKDVLRAVEVLEASGNEKILVHCSKGKDRTGLVVAVFSVRNKNLCKAAAYSQMRHYGTSPLLFGLKPVLESPEVKQNPGCASEF